MSIRHVRLSGETSNWRMDIEPCRDKLTPSRSTYNDGGLVGKSVRASTRSAIAVHVSIRLQAIAGMGLLMEKATIR